MRIPKAFRGFTKKFQRCLVIATTGTKGFQHFTLVIYCTSEIVGLTVDLHEYFVQVPLSVGERSQLLDTVQADFSGDYRAEPFQPKTDRFMADADTALVQQVFDISQRKRETDV